MVENSTLSIQLLRHVLGMLIPKSFLHRSFLERVKAICHSFSHPFTASIRLAGEQSLQQDDQVCASSSAMDDSPVFKFALHPSSRHSRDTKLRMNYEPQQAHRHRTQEDRTASERAENPPVGFGRLRHRELKLCSKSAPDKKAWRRRPCVRPVESELQRP